jgi:hypothetical protein
MLSVLTSFSPRDYLTTIPLEILVKILADVPISDYLDLVHTSRGLRDIIRAAAPQLCNQAIRSRHAAMAKYLESEMLGGWLVPMHKFFTLEENIYQFSFSKFSSFSHLQLEEGKNYKDYSILGEVVRRTTWDWDTFIPIRSPGPQFLHPLDHRILCIGCLRHGADSHCSCLFTQEKTHPKWFCV